MRCLFEDFKPHIKYIHFSEFDKMPVERDIKKGEDNSNSASNKKKFTGISIKSQKM